MPKFSIIIPVYNVRNYIKRTLDSVFSQSYKDFEVIVVDDGSSDGSIDIAKEYDVKIISSSHVGVSEARNIGEAKARGEYIIFLDSDDYWDKNLLKEVSRSLKNSPDLVRFQVRTVTDENERCDFCEASFEGLSGEEAFRLIAGFHYVESIWCYAIKRKFYDLEKFQFKKGMIHEDFGLTLLIIIKAKIVNSISYIGYNYYRRSGSIMNTTSYDWTKKKVHDFYHHYLFLREEIEKVPVDRRIFKSFIANSMILKITELKGREYRQYKSLLKKEKVYDDLLTDTFSRKMKKIMMMISPKISKEMIR